MCTFQYYLIFLFPPATHLLGNSFLVIEQEEETNFYTGLAIP